MEESGPGRVSPIPSVSKMVLVYVYLLGIETSSWKTGQRFGDKVKDGISPPRIQPIAIPRYTSQLEVLSSQTTKMLRYALAMYVTKEKVI